MQQLEPKSVYCPYCGESIEIFIDCSVAEQNYVEDCQVCCRPIQVHAAIDSEGQAEVAVYHENE